MPILRNLNIHEILILLTQSRRLHSLEKLSHLIIMGQRERTEQGICTAWRQQRQKAALGTHWGGPPGVPLAVQSPVGLDICKHLCLQQASWAGLHTSQCSFQRSRQRLPPSPKLRGVHVPGQVDLSLPPINVSSLFLIWKCHSVLHMYNLVSIWKGNI